MNTLIIDGTEHKINDDVANLVLLISKERDELKKTLTENSEPSANLPCSGVLCKTPLIDKDKLTPSQYIKSTDIDDEYNKLHAENQIVIAALKEIANWPFDIDGFDTAKEAACGMSGRANWVLSDIA
jgi:hypothetical protein